MAVTEVYDTILVGRPPDWPEYGEMHFRLVDSLLGVLNLSCETGYVVRSYEFGFPAVREVSYPSALDDGTLDVTLFYGARAVSLDMVLRNTEDISGVGTVMYSEAHMRDRIMRYLSPLRRPILMFSEHGDSRVRFFTLRGSDAPVTVNRSKFNELDVSWVAPSGVMENVDTHRAQFFIGEDVAAEYHIHTVNNGSVPAHWRMTISGDLNSPQIELPGLNQKLWLNYHVEEPADVVIDSKTKTVRIGGKPVGYRYLDDRSDWFRIPPGEHIITLTHSALQHIGLPTAYWQPDPLATEHKGPSKWSSLVTHDVSANTHYLPNPAQYTDLIDLKNDTVQGDGKYGSVPDTGQPFGDGEYVRLGDTSQAFYQGGIWVGGHEPVSTEQWVWSAPIDPDTGEPVRSVVTLTYREAYL